MLKVDLIIANSFKNSLQYFFGIALYVLSNGGSNLTLSKISIGLFSFLLFYVAIYLYNDLIDYDLDRKNVFRSNIKALARGSINKKTAKMLIYTCMIVGLSLSLLINKAHILALITIGIFNFFYSSPYTKLKDNALTFPMTLVAIQFLKFSIGWLALTSSLSGLPLLYVTSLSFFYVFLSYFSKNPTLTIKEILNITFAKIILTFGVIAYILLPVFYSIKLVFLFLIITLTIFLAPIVSFLPFIHHQNSFEKSVYIVIVSNALMILFIMLLTWNNSIFA